MRSGAFAAIMALQAALLVATAGAHTGRNYNINGMNFDLWCQEQAHLPADRCDKRLPGDEKTFEDFRDKVDQYEVPYLQQKQRDMAIHRDIMQNDPIDNPASQDPQALSQDPNRPPGNPLP